jgi:hypothetical protein
MQLTFNVAIQIIDKIWNYKVKSVSLIDRLYLSKPFIQSQLSLLKTTTTIAKMASPTRSQPHAPGMFSEITTSFIVPFFLVALNLVAYKTSNDGRLPAFNVFISLYLLSAYFRRGRPSSTTVTSSDDKSVQKAESPKSKQKPKKVSRERSPLPRGHH